MRYLTINKESFETGQFTDGPPLYDNRPGDVEQVIKLRGGYFQVKSESRAGRAVLMANLIEKLHRAWAGTLPLSLALTFEPVPGLYKTLPVSPATLLCDTEPMVKQFLHDLCTTLCAKKLLLLHEINQDPALVLLQT